MRSRTATGVLSKAQRYLPLALAGALAVGADLSTDALADVFRLQPSIMLEQIFVDNVRSSSDDRDADGITSFTARIAAVLQTDHIDAIARVDAFYNEAWASNDLDGANGRGDVAARIDLYRDQLYVDMAASRQQVFLESSGSAADFLTGQNQLQQTDFSIGPTLSVELFGLADLKVLALYAQVLFDDPIVGPALAPLDDVSLKALSGQIGTGERASSYEAIVAASYLETDDDFQRRNVIGSVLLHLTGRLTAIGRIGYEKITDPTIAPVRGTIWSVGGRYALGGDSTFQLEYGHRFGDVSWLGDVNLALTPRLTVQGSYKDTLVPVQLTYLQDLEELFNEDGELDIPSPRAPGQADPTALDEIIRDRNFQFLAVYKVGLRSYEFAGRHIERRFLQLQETEKLVEFGVAVDEQLSRKLSFQCGLNYSETYQPLIGNQSTQNFSLNVLVGYQLGLNTRLSGGYLWQLQSSEDQNDSYENVLRFGVERAF